ncbi:NIPA-like protein 2 isoform X2 [Phyllostomus hastatus]|uniref:NIPA-like protein 2 isoform X2 n=1 Tax=Phyllostomus hastatus TaxID=9423 RepID=UPI001E67E3BD|nr:NIPA-like protein 2 isoform X2 [Phyllostomus hastatus]
MTTLSPWQVRTDTGAIRRGDEPGAAWTCPRPGGRGRQASRAVPRGRRQRAPRGHLARGERGRAAPGGAGREAHLRPRGGGSQVARGAGLAPGHRAGSGHAAARARPPWGAPPPGSLAELRGQEAADPEPERRERDLMAARALGGPGDAASAALDELSRNFTYGALGAGNGSLSRAWYRRNQIHLFGVFLAILGNLIISISLNIQKYSHLRLARQQHPRPFFKSVLWWGGVALMAVGETGNFAAYGFAPVTLIAPLGCMSVTGSAFISAVFLKENLRASDLLGMTLAFAGSYLLVNFAPNITQAISARTIQCYFVGWQFLIYVILEILIFCILLYFYKRKGMKHIVILLTLVALLGS